MDSSDEPTAIPRGRDATTVVVPRSDSGSAGRFTPGVILGGRYRIVSMLGRGGMGEVYRADDLKLGQAVALKFLPEELRATETARNRLYREARAGREVTHPNVCRLYDVVEIDQHIFISMEYVDGEDLASLLRRIGRFSADKALAVVRDVCAGLAAIHDGGVIHADLKPGNIMIDGRGRARISDFGVAALTFEDANPRVIAGTPRYMAPEQFTGVLPSVQSDIYALGLVMAEVFTGQPVIHGSSIGEITAEQRNAEELSVRSLVPGLDPRIDDVIRACLRQETRERPRSAGEILQALPPRDPLAAAVAAGETPSPGMVMEARVSGELSRSTAAFLSLAAFAGVIAIGFLSARTMVYERQPILPPEVLESKAREMLALAAPRLSIAHSAAWMSRDGRAAEFLVEGTSTEATAGRLLYHFRSAPEAMAARNTEFRIVDDNPPFDRSGMARVVLDQSGNLVELAIVPPQVERRPLSPSYDWSPLLRETGIDLRTLAPSIPEWAAPADTDAKFAWTGAGSLRVEAATYHGRPVWLSVISPWTRPTRMDRTKPAAMNRVATTLNLVLLIIIPIMIILLAIRNTRRGHVDFQGATKAALFVGSTSFITAILRADHSSSLQSEWLALSLMTVYAAFWGVVVWGAYIAAEPLVRRRWPHMMIGWTRVLAGRWRDALAGREVLAGVCAAVAVLLAWHLSVLIPELLGEQVEPLSSAVTPLGSARQAAYYMMRALGEAILRAIGAAVVLLVCRVLVRNPMISNSLTVVVLALSFLADTTAPPVYRIAYALFGGLVVLFMLLRAGVLSVGVMAGVIIVMRSLPVTLDVTQWYFARGALALTAALILIVAGFVISLGTKSILPANLLDESPQ